MITIDKAMEYLVYYPDTGDLFVKSTKGCRLVGSRAKKRRYLFVKINGKTYTAHKLIWLLMTGKNIPIGLEIDHVNNVKDDNRWANLRLATRQQNIANVGSRRDGLKGAYRNHYRWAAKIGVNGRFIHLGNFLTEAEAHEAHMRAAKLYFGDYARAL
jgi:hypothetical protein